MAVAAAVAVAVAAAAAALPELAVQVVLILLQRKYYKYNDVMYNMVHGIHIFYIQYIYIYRHSQSSTRYMRASFDMRVKSIYLKKRCEFIHQNCPT